MRLCRVRANDARIRAYERQIFAAAGRPTTRITEQLKAKNALPHSFEYACGLLISFVGTNDDAFDGLHGALGIVIVAPIRLFPAYHVGIVSTTEQISLHIIPVHRPLV